MNRLPELLTLRARFVIQEGTLVVPAAGWLS